MTTKFYVIVKETGVKTGPFETHDVAHRKGTMFYGPLGFTIEEETEKPKATPKKSQESSE